MKQRFVQMIYLGMLIHRGVITVNSPPYIAVQKKELILVEWIGKKLELFKTAVSSSSTGVFKRKL